MIREIFEENVELCEMFDAILYRKSRKYPYVNEYDQSCDILYELCGVRASAGSVVVAAPSVSDKSAVFVDGRYKLAAKIALEKHSNSKNYSKFEILDNDLRSIVQWICGNLPAGSRLAYDSRFFSIRSLEEIEERLADYSLIPVDLEKILNLQPKKRNLNLTKLCCDGVLEIGERSKWAPIFAAIERNNVDAYLLCDPCSISWLLDLRDFSAEFSPVIFGYLLVKKGGETVLYLDDMYEKGAIDAEQLTDVVGAVKFEKDLAADLQDFGAIGSDAFETPAHISHLLPKSFRHVNNPCMEEKALKSAAEIDGMKRAAQADSEAIRKVLDWVKAEIQASSEKIVTELDVAKKLAEFRRENPDYMGESFACISAADEHSAIIHYSPTPESNAAICNLILLDTGGQYLYGTTDITRTIWIGVEEPTDDLKAFYTAVLRGHIAIARARFPEGTCFAQLEPLARQFLWQMCADYPHSTSHGIGYVSCVHESLGAAVDARDWRKTPLKPGMIVSNEPGYYLEGRFGIRLENMLLVKEVERNVEEAKGDRRSRRYLEFETISKVPFDARLIDKAVLSEEEIEWIAKFG